MKPDEFKSWLRGEPVEGVLSQREIDGGRTLQPKSFSVSTSGDDAIIKLGRKAGSLLSDLSDEELSDIAYNKNSEYELDLREFARDMVEKRRGSHVKKED